MSPPKLHHPRDKVCEHCGATFHAASRYAIQFQRFCNRTCRSRFMAPQQVKERVERPCAACGKVMLLRPHHVASNKRFCSYACSNGSVHNGPDAGMWKGGTEHWWQRAARKRDGNCRFNGCRDKDIHAHHMVPQAAGGLDAMDNLICLCEKHHAEMERILMERFLVAAPEASKAILRAVYVASMKPRGGVPFAFPECRAV